MFCGKTSHWKYPTVGSRVAKILSETTLRFTLDAWFENVVVYCRPDESKATWHISTHTPILAQHLHKQIPAVCNCNVFLILLCVRSLSMLRSSSSPVQSRVDCKQRVSRLFPWQPFESSYHWLIQLLTIIACTKYYCFTITDVIRRGCYAT